MKNNILVVDDDQLILYALAKAFKDYGYQVVTAATAMEAINKLSYCPYDLCLLDIHLPDLNGLELMKVIRDMCPRTKVIIMTASYHDSTELNENYYEALANGASYFIPKPFNLCDVTEVVQQVLKGEDVHDKDFLVTSNGSLKRSRKCPRKPCNENISFQMSIIDGGSVNRRSLEAQTVDISDTGIGLLTLYPLRESQIIGFDEKMDNKSGVVVWSRMIDEAQCRAGVKFA